MGLVLALCLAAGPLVAAARPARTADPASASFAQADPTTTITTTADLLVGQTTAPAATTTSTTAPAVSVEDARKRANADTRRVWYIVAALLAVAVLMTALTIRYWYTTRPGQQVTPRHARKLERRADAAQGAPAAEPEPEPVAAAPPTGGKHRSRRDRGDR